MLWLALTILTVVLADQCPRPVIQNPPNGASYAYLNVPSFINGFYTREDCNFIQVLVNGQEYGTVEGYQSGWNIGASTASSTYTLTIYSSTSYDGADKSLPLTSTYTVRPPTCPPPVLVSPVPGDFIRSSTPTLVGTLGGGADCAFVEIFYYNLGLPVRESIPVISGQWSYTTQTIQDGSVYFVFTPTTADKVQAGDPIFASLTIATRCSTPGFYIPQDGESITGDTIDFQGYANTLDSPCTAITLYNGDVVLGTTTAADFGWTFSAAGLAPGTYVVSVTLGTGGLTSAKSDPKTITLVAPPTHSVRPVCNRSLEIPRSMMPETDVDAASSSRTPVEAGYQMPR